MIPETLHMAFYVPSPMTQERERDSRVREGVLT